MKNQLRFAWLFTALLCPFQFAFLAPKDHWIIQQIQELFHTKMDFHSDSLELWLSIPVLFLLGLLLAKILKNRLSPINLGEWTAWVVAVVLIYYGADKIKMEQFPDAEVNLLYKPLHEFSKDLLFWTSMGTSTLFNLVAGCLELLTAVLLIFPSSRKIGWMVACLSFGFILLLNLSFDISVKAFVSFFFSICLLEGLPSFRRLVIYLWDRQEKNNLTVFARIVALNLLAIVALYPFEDSRVEEHIYSFEDGKLFISEQGYWIEKYSDGQVVQARILEQKDSEYWLLLAGNERIYRRLAKEKDEAYSTSSLFNRQLILKVESIPQIEDPLTFVSP
ncbi:MAG: hypothetical protein N4A41_04115 [Crocinitomicaceae bacterium]|jgi:hypothetical protein|nr:hypothetical protein [Crocinitomicaceae bacterium]